MQQPLLPGVDRKQIVQVVAIVLAIGGVFALLGGVGVVLGGTFIAAAGGSGLYTLGGILLLIEGVLSLVVAYGLFTRQPWGRMGTVVVAGLSVIAQIVWLLAGGGAGSIVQAVIYAAVAYFFYSDAELKAYFGES